MKPLRKARVMFKQAEVGVIEDVGTGYRFTYAPDYLTKGNAIGVAFPLRGQSYESKTLFRSNSWRKRQVFRIAGADWKENS